MRAIALANVNKAALVRVEEQLQRITDDLQVPMLTDIRGAIQQVQEQVAAGAVDQEGLQEAVQAAIGRELDARSGRGRGGSVREVIEANVSSPDAAAPASGCDVAGRVQARLGRVRFDMLVESEEILGEGAFGIVLAGEYMGQEVAIKKAQSIVGDQEVLNEFRLVFSDQNVGDCLY